MAEDQGKPIATVPSAADDFERLQAQIGERRPAVFLDFDGTLAPIAADPEAVRLSDEARAAVRALATTAAAVAVISGRDRADVEAKVGLPDLIYAGSHGFDIRIPGRGVAQSIADDFTPVLDQAEMRLHARLDGVRGALIERKRYSIAAHYRNVSDAEAHQVADAVAAVVAEEPQLRAKTGKKVFELQPAVDWDKGRAVLWLLARLGLDHSDVVPLFIGDDVTDEDAFRALKGRGIGIIVADDGEERTTLADFRLPNVDAVTELLLRIGLNARQEGRA